MAGHETLSVYTHGIPYGRHNFASQSGLPVNEGLMGALKKNKRET
jgi:hypothetical protein